MKVFKIYITVQLEGGVIASGELDYDQRAP